MLAVAERLRGGWSIAAFECWRLKPETIWGTPGGADVEAGAAESLWKVSKKEAKQAIGSAGVSLCFSFSSQKGQGKCFHSKASFGRSGARDTNAGSKSWGPGSPLLGTECKARPSTERRPGDASRARGKAEDAKQFSAWKRNCVETVVGL